MQYKLSLERWFFRHDESRCIVLRSYFQFLIKVRIFYSLCYLISSYEYRTQDISFQIVSRVSSHSHGKGIMDIQNPNIMPFFLLIIIWWEIIGNLKQFLIKYDGFVVALCPPDTLRWQRQILRVSVFSS